MNLDVKDYGDIDFGLSSRTSKAEAYSPTGGTHGEPKKLKNLKEVAGANKKVSSNLSPIF